MWSRQQQRYDLRPNYRCFWHFGHLLAQQGKHPHLPVEGAWNDPYPTEHAWNYTWPKAGIQKGLQCAVKNIEKSLKDSGTLPKIIRKLVIWRGSSFQNTLSSSTHKRKRVWRVTTADHANHKYIHWYIYTNTLEHRTTTTKYTTHTTHLRCTNRIAKWTTNIGTCLVFRLTVPHNSWKHGYWENESC